MWCRPCNIETNQNECPRCGNKTEAEVPVQVNWCPHCQIPLIQEVNSKEPCPITPSLLFQMDSIINFIFSLVFIPMRPSAGVHITSVLNRKNGFAPKFLSALKTMLCIL